MSGAPNWETLRKALAKKFSEDIVQETLLQFWKRIEDPTQLPVCNPLGYCQTSARRRVARERHRDSIFVQLEPGLDGTVDLSILDKAKNSITPERQAIAREGLRKAPPALVDFCLGENTTLDRQTVHRLRKWDKGIRRERQEDT